MNFRLGREKLKLKFVLFVCLIETWMSVIETQCKQIAPPNNSNSVYWLICLLVKLTMKYGLISWVSTK